MYSILILELLLVGGIFLFHRLKPSIGGRLWLSMGAVLAALAVAANAYATHVLRPGSSDTIDQMMRYGTFNDAARNQMLHAIALVLIGILGIHRPAHLMLHVSAAAFLLGILLFCGGLYCTAIWGPNGLTIAAPAGGISFMVGWVALAIASWLTRPA
jgi:uncharacterized membrane protein YgdD (TMEM256/DUF423 family)